MTGKPVIVARVVTGIPKAPKATGVVSNIKVYVKASTGSKLRNEAVRFFFSKDKKRNVICYPKETINEEQMAPGVPKPATPKYIIY